MRCLDRAKAYIKKRFLGKNLSQKVHVLFGFSISLYIILFLLFLIILKGNLDSHINEMNYDTMASIENDLNSSFENISTMGEIIINNSEIRSYLRSTQKSVDTFEVLSSIYSVATAFNNIDSIYVFKLDGGYINILNVFTEVNVGMIDNTEWKERVFSELGKNLILVNGDGLFHVGEGDNILSFIRVVNDINTQKPIGILAINTSMRLLENTYKTMSDTGKEFAFYDEAGTFLCGSNKCEFNDELKDADTFVTKRKAFGWLAHYYPMKEAPLILVENAKIDYIKQLPIQSIVLVILVAAVTIFCFTLFSLFIKHQITRPIESMVASMDNVKSGWLRRVGIKLPNDEMGKLKDSYNNMLIEINHLIEKLLDKEKYLRRVELEAMHEQIKPHFLYNTLDMIGSLALDDNAEDVYDAIEALGVFYRNFLNKGEQEILIGDELEIIKNYLKLQKLRYGKIIEEKIVVDKGLENRKILKLILQPLVENSLYHGAIPKGELCRIYIKIKETEKDIVISITDTGVGMSNDKIKKIMETDSKSFGLKRTIERIRNFYGREDVCQLKSKPGYYFQVILYIPKVTEKVISQDCYNTNRSSD